MDLVHESTTPEAALRPFPVRHLLDSIGVGRSFPNGIRDVSTGTNDLISARHPSLPSASPNGASIIYAHAISADGERIAFSSEADNLIESDTNAFRDVFVRDLLSGTNILVSAGTNGLPADNLSFEPALSADGRYVAFTSSADNLVPNDANRSSDVFVRDLVTG